MTEESLEALAERVRETLRANGVMRYGQFERKNTPDALAALATLLQRAQQAERESESRRQRAEHQRDRVEKLEARERKLREAAAEAYDAMERLDADIETNSESGTPAWFVAALTNLNETLGSLDSEGEA